MTHLILTADPLGLAATGVASYLLYVRAVCYAIAAVICIVGALSVYSDMMDGEPEVRMKVMRLVFSCVFLVTASTALPYFFGLNSDSDGILATGNSANYSGSYFDWWFKKTTVEGYKDVKISSTFTLPYGGTAVVWTHDGLENNQFITSELK